MVVVASVIRIALIENCDPGGFYIIKINHTQPCIVNCYMLVNHSAKLGPKSLPEATERI